MRWTARASAIAVAIALVLLCTPGTSRADASLENWTAGLCSGVGYWFGTAHQPPAPDPNGDEQLAIRRAVSNVINDAHSWMLYSVKNAPPVKNGRKLQTRIRRDLTSAVAELQRAADLLASPRGFTQNALAVAQRHLDRGYDQIVATMQRLRGHSGNARFDQEMTTNESCDYITSLTPIGSDSEV